MLTSDILTVECGAVILKKSEATISAWRRIKRKLVEGQIPTANKQSTPLKCKCGGTLKQAVMCDNCYVSTFGDGT